MSGMLDKCCRNCMYWVGAVLINNRGFCTHPSLDTRRKVTPEHYCRGYISVLPEKHIGKEIT
jgi:hypothetical protein